MAMRYQHADLLQRRVAFDDPAPVLRAPGIATAFASGQERAQCNASHLRVRNVARDDAYHDLVEKAEALVDAARRYEREAFVRCSTRLQCAVAELLCHAER